VGSVHPGLRLFRLKARLAGSLREQAGGKLTHDVAGP
jgi:hypothetical protein